MFQLILTASDGERVDATQRVSTMSLSGSIKQVSRQLTFELVLPRDGSLPGIPCALGTQAQLLVDGVQRFVGAVVKREKSTDSSLVSVTALDRGMYLTGNDGWFVFRGQTPESAVQAVCRSFGIPVGTLAQTGVPVSRKYPGVALSKIIDSLYTLAANQNGRRYLARFERRGSARGGGKAPDRSARACAGQKPPNADARPRTFQACATAWPSTPQSGELVRTVEEQRACQPVRAAAADCSPSASGEDAGPEPRRGFCRTTARSRP